MKIGKNILKTSSRVLVTAIVLLMGCQLPEKERLMSTTIEDQFREGSEQNMKLYEKSSSKLSQSVQNALIPDLQGLSNKNLPILQKRFDLYAEQVPAKAFFMSLVEGTNFNITVHPSVDGRISLQLKKVTIPEVLETVQSVYGYDYRQSSQGVEILPATLQTRAFQVNYLDIDRGGQSETIVSAGTLSGSSSSSSDDSSSTDSSSNSNGSTNSKVTSKTQSNFWGQLSEAIEAIIGDGEGRKVAISPVASLVVVQAMPEELKRVEEFLVSAELSLNRQVILEAKIIEVNLNKAYQAGINWALVSGRLSATQFGGNVVSSDFALNDDFPVNTTTLPSDIGINPGGTRANPANDVGSFGGVFALATNFKNLGTFLELLGAQGDVHVLSNPRVSTINNQKAVLKVGFEQFFITNVSSTSTAAAGGSIQTTPNVTFDSFFSGVALDVTPHITQNDDITLHIHPIISSVQDDNKTFTLNGESQSFPLAKSSVRESDNMVRARNGELVIIGGLMQNNTSNLKEGIPVLKDLPLIGGMFRHTVQTERKSELVILLRPLIVSDGVSAKMVDKSWDDFQRLNEDIQNVENPYRVKKP